MNTMQELLIERQDAVMAILKEKHYPIGPGLIASTLHIPWNTAKKVLKFLVETRTDVLAMKNGTYKLVRP